MIIITFLILMIFAYLIIFCLLNSNIFSYRITTDNNNYNGTVYPVNAGRGSRLLRQ